VNSDGVLRALVDRGLIEEAGRDETPGRPVLYATTPEFLERLGLPSLASLPSLAPLLGVDELAEEEGPRADAVVDAGLDDDSAADDLHEQPAADAAEDAAGPADEADELHEDDGAETTAGPADADPA
jgi:segregation and condensation protein B